MSVLSTMLERGITLGTVGSGNILIAQLSRLKILKLKSAEDKEC